MRTLDYEHPVYVLTTPTPMDVLSVLGDRSDFGPAVRCFLSPFDALLEMVFLLRHDAKAVEGVLLSSHLPRRVLYSGRLRQRPLTVHLAWLAHENRLVVHHDGHLFRVARDQAARWRQHHTAVAIEAATWSTLDRLHQSAGLFAWQETLQIARRWLASPAVEEASLRRAVAVLDAVDVIAVPPGDAKQLALYNPETGCWHFVPRDGTVWQKIDGGPRCGWPEMNTKLRGPK